MADPKLLEFTVLTFTPKQLEIKVKNISNKSLEEALTIDLYLEKSLVDTRIGQASEDAAAKEQGVESLVNIVTGPSGWSVWARAEASASSVIILLANDTDQTTCQPLDAPIKLAAGAEFTIRVPLNPQANRANVNLVYRYQHGTQDPDTEGKGQLELKSAEAEKWTPEVTLTTDAKNPTMIAPQTRVKIFWKIKDGVSATLRGPLAGGNNELDLNTNPNKPYPISEGSLEIRVVSSMIYVLQAEVKGPTGENMQVVRMLLLDTSNHKHSDVRCSPAKVLPFGLVEAYWAAWGVEQVEIFAAQTTRVVTLTQQTLGHYYEGSGVMRFNARKLPLGGTEEKVTLLAPPADKQSDSVLVVSWEQMTKPSINGKPLGLAVIAPKIALLTFNGLWIAEVGKFDPNPALKKLAFTLKTDVNTPTEWIALAAVDNRFVTLRRTDPSPDLEVAPYTLDGKPDTIPPLNLPEELRNLVSHPRAVFDLVGFGGRAYIVVEAPSPAGPARRAYSVRFDSSTKKAEFRSERLLECLPGYRLVTFNDALYALNRASGQMFRFGLTAGGMLDGPNKAASAVKKTAIPGQEESMIKEGLIVPVGKVLAVLSPGSVPSVESLQGFVLQNVLAYVMKEPPVDDPEKIPQDLFYNPQKNYWGRCGHDLDVKEGAVAAFRGGDSPRLWVIKPDGETSTLAVGSESLFAHDYVRNFPTKPLPPYLNKTREFKIKTLRMPIIALTGTYRKAGIPDFVGLAELLSPLPQGSVEFPVELRYSQAEPAPITVKMLVKRDTQSRRPDTDYMLELTFSGPDLSSATSVFRRLAIDSEGRLFNDEVFGSRTEHSTADPIQVPRPARFDDQIGFVIVNTSRFTLKLDGELSHVFIPAGNSQRIALKHTFADFSIGFDPKQEPSKSELRVNLNFALPPDIEALPGNQRQTKLIRLNTDKATKFDVKLVKTLKPGDAALNVGGKSITSMENAWVYVCHLDHKP